MTEPRNDYPLPPSPGGAPRSTPQAIGYAAEQVASALKGSPILLVLLLLNAVGIGGALWFFNASQIRNAAIVTQLLRACLPGVPTQ